LIFRLNQVAKLWDSRAGEICEAVETYVSYDHISSSSIQREALKSYSCRFKRMRFGLKNGREILLRPVALRMTG
jgi:hypothetical protein